MDNLESVVFTPSALLEVLSQIDELADVDVGLVESLDGKLQLQVGSSVYEINYDNSVEVDVDEAVVDTVEEVNMSTYEQLQSEDVDVMVYDDGQPIESGIIKEAVKSLLLGGMLRLSAKLLK